MKFKIWLENESEDIGKGFVRHVQGQNIDVDGHIEIDWLTPKDSSNAKEHIVDYQIFDVDNKLLKRGRFGWHDLPYDAVYHIVYELARREGINYPSNFIKENGEWITAGSSQPQIDQKVIKKYWHKINPILNA